MILSLLLAASARAGIVSLGSAEIERLRALVARDASARARWSEVRSLADGALKDAPAPVDELRSAGLLQGDPVKTRTQKAVQDFEKARALALVYAVDGDARSLAQARKFILGWAGVNKATGRPIDETVLEPMIEAYDLIRSTFDADGRRNVDDWLGRVAAAEIDQEPEILKSKPGTATNNWNSHRIKTVGLIGWTIGDVKMQDYARKAFERQVRANLNADGSSLDFHARDAVWYHAYDLAALGRLAILLARAGRRPYEEQAPSGASLKRSVAFLVPYATGAKTHAEFVGSKIEFDIARSKHGERGHVAGSLFEPRRALGALELAQYFEPGLSELVAELAGRPKDAFPTLRVLLNAATR